jgi:hypothetical protein
MKKSALYFLFILLSSSFALGIEGINQTGLNSTDSMLKIEIVLPDEILVGVVYDSLFKITNLNRTPGTESFVNVTVSYTVTKNNPVDASTNALLNTSINASLILMQSFSKIVNYYTSSGTGRLFLEESGNYTLCGAVTNAVANNSLNNANLTACKNLSAINPLTIPCFVEISMSADKSIYEAGESIRINNSLSNESLPFIIEYWVEDLMGRVAKAKQNTSNTNIKSFTPKIDEEDRVYILRNRLVFVGCNNSNAQFQSEKQIIVLDKGFEAKKQQQEKECQEKIDAASKKASEKSSAGTLAAAKSSDSKDSKNNSSASKQASKKSAKETPMIKSFYTLAKKYQASINLYANVNASPEYELFLIYQGKEQRIPFNRSEKIKINVTPKSGTNQFMLQLRNGSKVLSEKNLTVELSGGEEKPAQKKENLPNQTLLGKNNQPSKNDESIKNSQSSKPALNQTKSQAVKAASKKAEPDILLSNSSVSSGVPITGSVVYESANVKALKFAPYMLLFLAALALFGLLLKKSR